MYKRNARRSKETLGICCSFIREYTLNFRLAEIKWSPTKITKAIHRVSSETTLVTYKNKNHCVLHSLLLDVKTQEAGRQGLRFMVKMRCRYVFLSTF